MNFQNANPESNDIASTPAANETAGAHPGHTPVEPRQQPRTPELTTCGDIRAMLVLAIEGVVDLWAGHKSSAYLDRFESLYEKHSATLAAFRGNTGGADFGLLLARARAAFTNFGETLHREIAGIIGTDCEEKALDQALERVKASAIAAAVSLASIELALSKG